MKRVLVLQGKHLLTAGILNLLNRELDLKVFDTTISNEIILLDEIKKIKPEVLVMDESLHLTDRILFLNLLKECPGLRVIIINERKNLMHVYEKQEIKVGRGADLIAAIRKDEYLPF